MAKEKQKSLKQSARAHIGKFIDRMTVSDVLNLLAFAAASYTSYVGVKTYEAIEPPSWLDPFLRIAAPLSPLLYQFYGTRQAVREAPESVKIALSLLAGYSVVKLVPFKAEDDQKGAEILAMLGAS